MKILFDPQIYIIQNFGGISRYFTELICNLDKLKDVETHVPVKYSNNIYVEGWGKTNHSPFLPNHRFKGKRKLQLYLNRSYFLQEVKNTDYDIYHPTYYDSYFLSHVKKMPFVVTVHDMTHEKFPSVFPRRDKTSILKKELVNNADRVIAVSQNTKSDLINIFGVQEEKIDVVYHGCSIRKTETGSHGEVNLPGKYILFVGRRNQYKNFIRLLNAIAPILKSDKELHLLCAGGKLFTKAEHKLIHSLGIEERIHQRIMDDNELMIAYTNAICFVFPSLYEGFGLPLIEAFSAGCPVVCSNSGAMPEIAGNGAVFFDPFSESDIRRSVKKVVDSESLRNDLVEEGYKRAKKYSWENTAKITKSVYEKVL